MHGKKEEFFVLVQFLCFGACINVIKKNLVGSEFPDRSSIFFMLLLFLQIYCHQSRYACDVREIQNSRIWEMSACILSGTTCASGWTFRSPQKLHCQCILSKMSRTFFPQKYTPSEHRRCLFRHYISTFIPHDASSKQCSPDLMIIWLLFVQRFVVDDFIRSTNPMISLTPTFSSRLLLQDMIPAKPSQTYVPRVYGFKVNKSSLFYINHEEGPPKKSIDSSARNSRHPRDRSRRK